MRKSINVGDKFSLTRSDGFTYQYERLEDDPDPMFECERIRIKVTYPSVLKYSPSIFGTEPEWFIQRGLTAG